ncbi:MAG: glycosyltransferase family 2 protein [Deltaproteobacteria bacterium]|nr:glycosyltransferase family 2 protein [Deltaproteobacteria bacterium]
MRKGLIIIPAYNEGTNLEAVLRALLMPGRRETCDVDVLVVDDASDDQTRGIAISQGVLCVTHPCNLGYATALQTGMRYALQRDYAFCIFFDADGQHDPEALVRLIHERGTTGADMVIGSRYLQRGMALPASRLRHWGSVLFACFVSLLTGHRFTDTTSGLRLLTRRGMHWLVQETLGDFNAETIVYLIWRGARVVEIPIQARPRLAGVSMHSLTHASFYPFKTVLLTVVLLIKAISVRRALR